MRDVVLCSNGRLGVWRPWRALAVGALALVWGACHAEPSTTATDTRTNWLRPCESDTDCGELSCYCGACSRSCDADRDCRDLEADAACQVASACAEVAWACVRGSNDPRAATDNAPLVGAGTNTGGAGGAGGSASDAGGTNSGGSTGGGNTSGTGSGTTGGVGGNGAAPTGGTVSTAGAGGGIAGAATSGGVSVGGGSGPRGGADAGGGHGGDGTEPTTCTALANQCRTVEAGVVIYDRPCCGGATCELEGGSSSSDTEVYFCRNGQTACPPGCEVTMNPACDSATAGPILWTCDTADIPAELPANCTDMMTSVPRYCCPYTLLPECGPMP